MNPSYYEVVQKTFDSASVGYDQDEERNIIRRMMRTQSLRVLKSTFQLGQKVIEIGCGTGTEAIELAKSGLTVVATDISAEMIARLKRRAAIENLTHRIHAEQCAAHELENLQRIYGPRSFDGAYSSFGALNCEPRLKEFISSLASLLKPRSRFVSSIMNKFCGFDLTLNALLFKKNNRLDSRECIRVGDYLLRTRFYSFGEFKRAFRDFFSVEHVRALPAVLPPPYFEKHVRILLPPLAQALDLDWAIGKFFPFNRLGDHFLATFRKLQ